VRALLKVAILTSLITSGLTASSIKTNLSNAGTNGFGETVYEYDYIITGLDLLQNQELAIQFDPSIYKELSNGVAPATFSLLLFQPNLPPGASGEYSALSTVDHPSMTGPFSVQFTLTDLGMILRNELGPQVFVVNKYDSNGGFVGIVTSGSTSPGANNTVPEPSSLSLTSVGLMLSGVGWALRRRLVNTP
jgi:hypothetical protein